MKLSSPNTSRLTVEIQYTYRLSCRRTLAKRIQWINEEMEEKFVSLIRVGFTSPTSRGKSSLHHQINLEEQG
jgi:hypothetical protein